MTLRFVAHVCAIVVFTDFHTQEVVVYGFIRYPDHMTDFPMKNIVLMLLVPYVLMRLVP